MMNLTIGWDASRVVFSQSIDKMDFSLYTKAKKETVFILDRLVLVIDEKSFLNSCSRVRTKSQVII